MARAARWFFPLLLFASAKCWGQAVTVPSSVMVDANGKIQSATLRDHLDTQSSNVDPHKAAQIAQLRRQLADPNATGTSTALRLQLNALEIDALQDLLDRKQEVVDRLKLEVDELRRPHEQVAVHVSLRAIEVSRTKLRSMGRENEFLRVFGDPTVDRTMRVADDTSQMNALVRELVDKDCAKIVAEPTLTLMNGRLGTYVAGGEAPAVQVAKDNFYSQRMIPFGTLVTMMPVLQRDGSVRLTFSLDLREIDRSLGYQKDQVTSLGFRTRQFSTSANLRSGQTLVMSGMRTERSDASAIGKFLRNPPEQWETLVLVRAEFPAEFPMGK